MQPVHKFTVLFFLALLWFSSAHTQPYGNEWIYAEGFNKPYYKIKIARDGVYRLPFQLLNDNIQNLSSIRGDQFAIYHDGVQIPVYRSNSGTLNSGDFLEFYAQDNDGTFDRALYADSSWQPNPHYSLFNDTAVYFLCWNQNQNLSIDAIANNLSSPPAAETHFYHTERVQFTDYFSKGKPYRIGPERLYSSQFEEGEGFTGTLFSQATDFAIPSDAVAGFSSLPFELEATLLCVSNQTHRLLFEFNGVQLRDTTINGFKLSKHRFSGSNQILNASNQFRIEPLASGNDQNSLAWISLSYPRRYDFSGNSNFSWQVANQNRIYIEFENFNNGAQAPIIYDLTNAHRVEVTEISNGTFAVALPAVTSSRNLHLFANNQQGVNDIIQLEEINFTDFNRLVNQGQFLLLHHERLNGAAQVIEAYRQHRDLQTNPNADEIALSIEVSELYDQFAFGIEKHPLAIQRFTAFALNEWSIPPNNLFLVGKGREYHEMRNNRAVFNACQIPAFGQPPSASLLTAVPGSIIPRIPVGRLSVSNESELATYLEKVIQYEDEQNSFGDPHQTIANKAWMKQLLHFGGGTNRPQQDAFKGFLKGYESIATDTFMGIAVDSFYKTSSNAISTLQSERLHSRLNEGISMLTFFGHSSPGLFDVNFDEPENYTNFGKYPIVFSLGCFSGYIYGSAQGLSERFVLSPDKGAIAFLSTTNLSNDISLNVFAEHFYQNLAVNKYNQSFGNVIQATIEQIEQSPSSIFNTMIAQEMTLHGDPALQFNSYDFPDYAIETASISFSPTIVTAADDSFDVIVNVTNLGKAINDSFNINVTRHFDNGTELSRSQRVAAAYFKSSHAIRFSTLNAEQGLGLNRFSIKIDADDEISNELSETNNELLQARDLVILADDLLPVYPTDFAIVPNEQIEMISSTVDPLTTIQNYYFEIDTSELFNSPLLARLNQISSGGVLRWQSPIPFSDSTVYYWRVSRDSSIQGSFNWHERSFIYIKDEFSGWNQSHYYQFLKDDYAQLQLDNDRQFRFVDDLKELRVQSGLWSNFGGTLDDEQIAWWLNGALMHRWRMGGCGGTAGITLAVIDDLSGEPWFSEHTAGQDFNPRFGNYHCRDKTDDQFGFNFRTSGTHPTLGIDWGTVIAAFIDSVPDSHYILAYTHNNADYQNWSQALVNTFVDLGAVELLSLTQGIAAASPYIFFARKGQPAFTGQFEQKSAGFNQAIDYSSTFTVKWNTGQLTSPLIGPAAEWGSVHWQIDSLSADSTDQQNLTVIGVRNNRTEEELFDLFATDSILFAVDAQEFPFLRLEPRFADPSNRSPAQLDYHRVLFKPLPEAALNPLIAYSFDRDSLFQTGKVSLEFGVENISDLHMDSLLVRYQIQHTGGIFAQSELRYDSLRAEDSMLLHFELPIEVSWPAGDYSLFIDVNPDNDQPEQFHFNNIAIIDFSIDADLFNPLLSVTFDSVHIENGDLVSASSTIDIVVFDENRRLLLNDSSLVNLQLSYPDGQTVQRDATFDDIQFYPAPDHSGANRMRLNWSPLLNQDGLYRLTVKDYDVSGNSSSIDEYSIQFRVVQEAGISAVTIGPNPVSESAWFEFTLTGSEVPDQFYIDIFNTAGQFINRISPQKQLRVGSNRIKWAIGGTNGAAALPNGLYFYRAFHSLRNEELPHIESRQDRLLHKGTGRFVILQ